MHSEKTHRDVGASPLGAGVPPPGPLRLSRRRVIGRMSAMAGAGAVAWVVPEILTAKPAAGATLSGSSSSGGGGTTSGGVTTSASTTGDPGANVTSGGDGANETSAVTAAATTPSKTLAFTGLDITRDAEIGAALVAGGWAMQHWASRTPKLAADGRIEAGSAGDAS